MKNLLIALTVIILGSSHAISQQAPDFTAKDIMGKEHHLYQYLESGKFVLIDFFATY